MKNNRLAKSRGALVIALLSASFCHVSHVAGQNAGLSSSQLFSGAKIRMDQQSQTPLDVKFPEGTQAPVSAFFAEYKKAFGLSDDNELKPFQVFSDQLGQTHQRCKQYYQGLELAEVQYLLHEKNGRLFHAHGRMIHGLALETRPVLPEAQALQRALDHIQAESYLWQNKANENALKKEQHDRAATFYPTGRLLFSPGNLELRAENFRLAYRFDIYAEKPWGRYEVDVDANTGEVIRKISRIQNDDVLGLGQSVYNGVVPITVGKNISPDPPRPSHWHLNTYQAHGGSGESWWLADPNLGIQGGYDNGWYEFLDTAPIAITASDASLKFYHRYAVEPPPQPFPGFPYDAWDAMNVRISTDSGATWQILRNSSPAYNSRNVYCFDADFGEGKNIPGWTGTKAAWSPVTIPLSAYAGQTIQLRFAFGSDGSVSTSDFLPLLFGWQIDDIIVTQADDTLFQNRGAAGGVAAINLAREINFIAGNFRLREDGRADKGLVTYDMQNKFSFFLATDFVDADSNFSESRAPAGVSTHWAAEAGYDYYSARHGRESYDNAGGKIVSYAHVDSNFNDAFWDGSRMFFGDGPANQMPLVTLDIVGHELTHGVTQYSANLIYLNESGALNESFSDIFGEALEGFKQGQVDWGNFFRSYRDPNTFEDPDTYLGQFWFPISPNPNNPGPDNGGVHTNSGVQNHWFYLLSVGGGGVDDHGRPYSVQGLGMEQAEQIAYRNLTVYLTPSSGYFNAREASIYSALDLFGVNSPQYLAMLEAWSAVGVYYPNLEPTLAASPDTLHFLAEAAAGADTAELTVSNFGFSDLIITAIEISGPPFQMVSAPNFPVVVQYGFDYKLQIVFRPDSVGSSTGFLKFTSNDFLNATTTVTLEGRGFGFSPAKERVIYAVTGTVSRGALVTLDPNTGSAGEVGLTGFQEITGAAIQPSTGVIYGTIAGAASTTLVKLDAATGEAHASAVIPVPGMRAIAFDRNDDLYGVRFTDGVLFRIDPATGDTTRVGATRLRAIAGLAIHPLDGSLWGMPFGNMLYKIDKATAATTLVGNIGVNQVAEIEFDGVGHLFGLTGLASQTINELIQIDPATGRGTRIGSTGFRTVYGLAIRGEIITGIEEALADESLPSRYELRQNYPNPFLSEAKALLSANAGTTITYALPKPGEVKLVIYDHLGRRVKVLVHEVQSPGVKLVSWNGADDHGQKVASGVYMYRITTEGYSTTRKLLLVK